MKRRRVSSFLGIGLCIAILLTIGGLLLYGKRQRVAQEFAEQAAAAGLGSDTGKPATPLRLNSTARW
ncbi:hypothetical protein A3H75_03470 [Candidatus Uhrbacteria bacterium RIFCSPLOWO2_02_FULL_51_9]|uniref:Uncharacterized protein n=1 Tax=Candidatus Uhrbacteria bacterium RIFCSPLOWO2_02_FULL_51_9 TaxID=1802410 RepID=A0A1F7VEU3_9BACT|nr:MAG: hypothetical protein A3H75_03470 [Candidatus Uhrbacteria bacterium RIFCSPLOWO2_02_FULL_51_9]